ncbi:MAG: GNAT family protein [Nocardioidaceae bacterium]
MTRVNGHGQPIGEAVPGWSARPFPQRVVLSGRYVRLEPVTVDHAAGLHQALAGPDDDPLWTYRPGERPADLAGMAALVATAEAATDAVTFAIVPAGEDPQGLASLMRVDPAQGSVEVGSIIFSRALQRTRAATEALALLAGYVFDELGFRRFEWKCDSLNEPSRAAAHRLGFVYEGRFRQALVYKGRNRDTDWFSITDGEWPTVKAAYDAWLDPANFDADGDQRRRLSVLTARR